MHTVTHQPHTMNRRKYSTSRQRQTIQLPHAALYSSVNRSASSSSFFRSLTDWCCIVASVTDSKRPNRSRLEKSTAWTVQSTQYTNPRETNFFYSPPFLPLSFWCWATKAYISSPSFCPLSLKVYDVARIERKRELTPSCAKHIYIYIQYSQYSQYTGGKAMEKYESYLCRPTVSFWSRLLSVISDGQTGGWGPCAAQQPAYSSLSSSPVSAIGSIQRVSSANSPDIRECFQIFRKSYYFW